MPPALARIDQWLAAHRPAYYARLRPGAGDADLDAFERRCALPPLPASFRALYRWRDGQDVACSEGFEANRMFSRLATVAAHKEMLDEMIGTDFDDPRWWRRAWVPFLDNGAGDHVCLDLTAEDGGAPGQVRHFWHDSEDRRATHASLDAWLADLADAMEAGAYKAS